MERLPMVNAGHWEVCVKKILREESGSIRDMTLQIANEFFCNICKYKKYKAVKSDKIYYSGFIVNLTTKHVSFA